MMTAFEPVPSDKGTTYKVSFTGPEGNSASFEFNDGGNIIFVDDQVESITGFKKRISWFKFLLQALCDRQRDRGTLSR